MPRWLPISLFVAALVAALWRAPLPAPAAFSGFPSAPEKSWPAEFFSEKIEATNGEIGPSSLAQLPDGRLLLAWQENRTEDPADTTIRLIIQDKAGNWGKAKEMASRASSAASSFAYLSQLGRPLLYAEGHWLHLWFISHGVSDWRSAAINHSFSSDGGKTWSAQRKTAIGAGFNPGGLRLAQPIPLNNAELALPLLENSGEVKSWLRLAATGQIIDKARLQEGQHLLLHGAVTVNLPAGAESVLALSGEKLLAAGHPDNNRKVLQLWQSEDGGLNWQKTRIVEQADDGAAEFAHPFLLLAGNGRIHLSYTWRRQGIRHLYFSEAWLNEKEKQ